MGEPIPERLELGNRIRIAREQAGLSQGQVARMLGLHRPAVSEMEAGRRKVAAEELSRLSELYDVSVTWLLSKGSEVTDARVELAARELGKLKADDLDRVLNLLQTLRSE